MKFTYSLLQATVHLNDIEEFPSSHPRQGSRAQRVLQPRRVSFEAADKRAAMPVGAVAPRDIVELFMDHDVLVLNPHLLEHSAEKFVVIASVSATSDIRRDNGCFSMKFD